MARTNIEWTKYSYNPVVGCSHVSVGCHRCYAERMAKRLKGIGLPQYQGVVDENGWTGKTAIVPAQKLDEPMKWKTSSLVFVGSMGDLFHETVAFETIDEVFGIMAVAHATRGHVFQVLTKRPERMLEYFEFEREHAGFGCYKPTRVHIASAAMRWASNRYNASLMFENVANGEWWPLPGVITGTSVENQKTANDRIPFLVQVPGRHFISYEPAIGMVDFVQAIGEPEDVDWDVVNMIDDEGELEEFIEECEAECDWINCGHDLVENPEYREHRQWRERRARLNKLSRLIDWIVAGAETGPGARPSHPACFLRARDQCKMAEIPFLFKSWGEWAPNSAEYSDLVRYEWDPNSADYSYLVRQWRDSGRLHENVCVFKDGMTMLKVGRHKSGRLLDGQVWDEFPDFVPLREGTLRQEGGDGA